MAVPGNGAPVIIKRKKVIGGGGHHGGAWKVAYADFVTAMMAFFMLMWLLNATTEKQRKGIADYFNPTIPVNRISGGGDGSFGGDSVLSEQTLAQNGTGASSTTTTAANQARGQDGGEAARQAEQRLLQAMEQALLAQSGESATMQSLMRHVITRVTDEGLVIELFDLPESPLFAGETATPASVLPQIAAVLVEVLSLATNAIAINGHVRAYPAPLTVDPTWDLSADRAQTMRLLLRQAGLDPNRMQRIAGFADRKPATTDPTAARNNRLEVILLRRN
ncbi:MAG: hypothetical protein RIT14_1387 [Pseudomonadota bacterium]|jgi:chemotaxis protein MotB